MQFPLTPNYVSFLVASFSLHYIAQLRGGWLILHLLRATCWYVWKVFPFCCCNVNGCLILELVCLGYSWNVFPIWCCQHVIGVGQGFGFLMGGYFFKALWCFFRLGMVFWFLVPSFSAFLLFPAFLLLCFSSFLCFSLLSSACLCFSLSLLFSACLLFRVFVLCFCASLLFCFSAFWPLCFSAFLLFPAVFCFFDSLLLRFSAFPCFFAVRSISFQ